MSQPPELPGEDGLGLAQLIRDGQLSATEALDIAIARAEALNPALNAIIRPMYDEARATLAAGVPDGPFAGVPFLIKDLLSDYKGVPTTCGSRLMQDFVPQWDSELVARYKRAGLVIFGKTNTPEFGLTPFTEPELHGPTRNPWNLEKTPGGSSGGSGAAVAARIVHMAGGGDGGGSIRIPASCCGIVGLKPSRGRNPTGPVNGDMWFGAVAEHPLTVSVRDTAALLDACAGPEVGPLRYAPEPAQPWLKSLDTPVRPLKIAMTTEPMLGDTMHSQCVAGAEETARKLQDLGHTVELAPSPIDKAAMMHAFVVMLVCNTAAELDASAAAAGQKLTRDKVEPNTWALAKLGRVYSGPELTAALAELQRQTRKVGQFMQGYDAWLTPTLSRPPFTIGDLQLSGGDAVGVAALGRLPLAGIAKRSGLLDQIAADSLAFIPNTPVSNVTGQPSISLPLFESAAGLPIGMMFTGQFGDETTLLQLARQLEQAHPWANKRPPVAGASQ